MRKKRDKGPLAANRNKVCLLGERNGDNGGKGKVGNHLGDRVVINEEKVAETSLGRIFSNGAITCLYLEHHGCFD